MIGGYPDGTFKPEKNISFAEAAKIIAVAFGREVSSGGSVWYEGYVRSLADAHAIPVSITDFTKQLSRGEMAEMIYRLHAKIMTNAFTSYEKLAGLPEPVSASSLSMSSAAASVGYKPYPYTFKISPTWKTDWNFYIDTVSPPVEDEKGYNYLAALYVDNAERMEDPHGKFSEFLRVKFPMGSAGPYISHFYQKPLGGVIGRALGSMKSAESLHLTYFVRFPKDFDFSRSGILPVLGGGIRASSYGAFGNEFSVGLYWTKKGEIGISGGFDIGSEQTTRVTGSTFVADGEWHRVDITANMNTIPVKRLNGVLIVQYDNTVIFNFDNIRFRSKAEEMWDSLGLYATDGDDIAFQITPKDMYLDLAGFTLEK